MDDVKACARALGMYRAARWTQRHVLNRAELRVFTGELAFYRQFVGPGCLCFDVGANYGAKTEVFLRLGARVVAFEPQLDCLRELQARIGTNRHLVPVNSAVGSEPGRLTLYVERHRTGSSFVKNWEGEVVGSVDVAVITLDDAIAQFGLPQYCKIDVEGFELEVLKGLSQAIPTLSYEYHLQRDGPAQAVACLEYLSRFGDLLVNVTPAETSAFARERWWPMSEFTEFFLGTLPGMSGYGYGDIFVKFQRSA